MGKRKSKEGSISGYFRQLFAERPEWVDEKSNDAIFARYRDDNNLAPEEPIAKNIKQNMANVKSDLRKKQRAGDEDRTEAKRGWPHEAPARSASPTRQGDERLEQLEEMIDDCLTLAKNQDREGLHEIIQMLRRARNEVVWRLGEK